MPITLMRSRKKRRRKKASSTRYQPKLTFDEGGIQVFGFICGMVSTLLALFLAWNYITTNYFATPETTQKVLNDVSKVGPAAAVGNINSKDFERVVESASSDQLASILLDLNNWNRQASAPDQVEAHNRRIDVANEMLTMPLSEKQRELAIDSKIDALGIIYGLDLLHDLNEPKVAATLRAEAAKFLRDGNSNIARTARLAMLKHDAFELAKDADRPNVDPVANQVVNLLIDYPDDDTVMDTIRLIVRFFGNFNSSQGSASGLALMRKIIARAAEFDSPKVIELVEEFSDQAKMLEVNYQQTFENRWVNGPIGQENLLEQSVELLSDPAIGPATVTFIDKVAFWFEQEDQYQRAINIYEAMLDASKSIANEKAAKIARKMAQDGIRRSSLVDQQLDFSGTQIKFNSADNSIFENRVVVVVFWSKANRDSMNSLAAICKDSKAWRTRGGVLVAVPVDQATNSNLSSIAAEMPGVHFVNGSDENGAKTSIYDQCPSPRIPRAMLVDQDGIVVDVNLPMTEVKTEVGFLLSN